MPDSMLGPACLRGSAARHGTILAVLLLAAGVAAAPPPERERLSAFSWDRVPRYMHVRKDTSFSPDEIRYLASFPLITFEKSTGAGEYGSVEEGTLAAARAVKAINPAARILYYRNALVHYGGYSANALLAEIPGAFLVGREGGGKLVRDRVEAYDLTNERVRSWWLDDAKRVCADPAIDGLFVDGPVKVLDPGYLRSVVGEEKKAQLVGGYKSMMKDARRILGPDKLLVANLLRARFPDSGLSALRAFDGSYMEAFETTVGNVAPKDYVAKGIAAFQDAARQGYLIAFSAGLGARADDDGNNPELTDEMRGAVLNDAATARRFSYLLATFLICAEEHSYFYAHDTYDAKKSKVWMTRFPEYDRPLGPPKGPAVRTGYCYSREFAHATVDLNVEARSGRIVWSDSQ